MLKRHLPLVLVTSVLLGLAIGAVLWLNNSPPSSATEPVADATSVDEAKMIYDTTRYGYGNEGHTFADALSTRERQAVIEYLKTL